MAKVIVTETYLENIGDAIRSKLGGSDTYKPSEMAGAISQIHGEPVLEALSVTENGTYDPSSGKDGFSQAVVNVPNSYAAGDEGKVVSSGALVSQTSATKTANGTYDTTLNNEIVVSVANSYSQSDEGKVVNNGALVAQTSDTVTENDTYDTTLINQLTVNVAGGGGGGSQIIKGTSDPSSSAGSNNDLYIKYHDGYPETTYTRAIKDLVMTSNDYTDSNGFRFIASASSNIDGTRLAYKAFNGSHSGEYDCWHPSSGTPQWLQLQFPQKIIITGFTIYNRPTQPEKPTAFTVQGSDDGSTWTDLVEVSWAETGSGIHKDVVIPSTENGFYYYRLYITGVTSYPYGVIGEIDFTELHEPNAQATSQIADEAFVKVNGTWMGIIGADVSEVTSGGGSSKQYGAPRITAFKNTVGVESEEVSN